MTASNFARTAYELLFGRAAGDVESVNSMVADSNTPEDVLRRMLSSREYMQHRAAQEFFPLVRSGVVSRAAKVEIDVEPAVLDALFARIRKQWQALGASEPYWSVLTNDRFRKSEIEKHRGEFELSGKHAVDMLDLAADRGRVAIPAGTCLELGCGVGRVTRYLANRFDRVVALDVSEGNLEVCRDYLARSNVKNTYIQLLRSPQELANIEPFDVLYSVIVLQHNPPPVIKYFLDVLLSKIRPGGVAYFQLPTHTPGYSFSVSPYLKSDTALLDMHVLPMPEVFSCLARAGMEIREVLLDTATGLYGSHTFIAVKPTARI